MIPLIPSRDSPETIYMMNGTMWAQFIGAFAPHCPELTDVSGVPHVILEHQSDSFLAVPLDPNLIFDPLEAVVQAGFTKGYRDVIDCGQAVEIRGAVWVFIKDKDGRAVPHARA